MGATTLFVNSSLATVADALSPRLVFKTVNYKPYYGSVNLLVYADNSTAAADRNNDQILQPPTSGKSSNNSSSSSYYCEYSLYFLRRNVLLNLLTDDQVDMFVARCQRTFNRIVADAAASVSSINVR